MPQGKPTPDVLQGEILARLDAGQSIAGVARDLGLSRTAVRNCRVRREEGAMPRLWLRAGETALEVPIRCPDCGGMIDIVPCRLCAVRVYKQQLRQLIGRVLPSPPRRRAG